MARLLAAEPSHHDVLLTPRSCPFVILAHYNELAWAAQYGAEADLIRFSVGLEDTFELVKVFERALENLDRVVGIS